MPPKQQKKNPLLNSNASSESRPNTANPNPITSTPIESPGTLASFTPHSGIASFQGSPSASLSQSDLIRLGQALANSGSPGSLIPSPGFITFPSQSLSSNLIIGSQQATVPTNMLLSEVNTAPAPVKRARGRPKKAEIKMSEDKPKSGQLSWFAERSDGYSDMDMVALWCAELDNFDRWRNAVPSKIVVATMLSNYLEEKDRPGRSPRECEKKLVWLEDKFKAAFAIVNSTGQGILDREDFKEELKGLDLISISVNSDGEEEVVGRIFRSKRKGSYKAPESASPLEKALAICPWFLVLETVMLERSNIVPEATQDTLGTCVAESLTSDLFSSKRNLEAAGSDEDDESKRGGLVMDDDLEENITAAEEIERARQESRVGGTVRDPLGLQTLMTNMIPSKTEREAAARIERKKEKKQLELTSKIAKAISVMSHNRQEDIQLKREQLRGEAVTKFMGMGDTFEEAFRKASMMYPDTKKTDVDVIIQGSSKDIMSSPDDSHEDDDSYGSPDC
ncbi:hypothetical protein DFH28DRAFT_1135229 [Melampsora americana]|nr:hypothetical protein DFH28DRAFT_1135229 [Melampsora americana]